MVHNFAQCLDQRIRRPFEGKLFKREIEAHVAIGEIPKPSNGIFPKSGFQRFVFRVTNDFAQNTDEQVRHDNCTIGLDPADQRLKAFNFVFSGIPDGLNIVAQFPNPKGLFNLFDGDERAACTNFAKRVFVRPQGKVAARLFCLAGDDIGSMHDV